METGFLLFAFFALNILGVVTHHWLNRLLFLMNVQDLFSAYDYASVIYCWYCLI